MESISETVRERQKWKALGIFLLKIYTAGALFLLCLFCLPQPALAKAKVRLAIVDTTYGSDCASLARMFRAYGASVTWIHKSLDIRPGKYDGLLIPGGGRYLPEELWRES